MSRTASSSSRATRSSQKSAPCATMSAADVGTGAVGPRSVTVASRSARASSTDTEPYSIPCCERTRASGSSAMPRAPAPPRRTVGLGGKFLHASGNEFFELRIGHHLVDQPPVDRAPAFDAFLGGAEEIGVVVSHLAFVGQSGEAAGARQYGKQRQLRKRHR